MTDFEQHKITTFPGINDIPIAPTATAGSNISHMHQQFNNLIDSVVTGNQELRDSITYNYDYFYDYCSSNKGFINANATTISNNKTYHDNITNNIQTNQAQLTGRVDNLENTLLPQSIFEFDNVTLTPDGTGRYKYDINIPVTGQLQYILIDDTFDGNDWAFSVDGGGLFFSTGTSNNNNYIYAYDIGLYYQDVTQNQTLTLITTSDDTAISKVLLKILSQPEVETVEVNEFNNLSDRVTELENTITVLQAQLAGNQTDFIINNVTFTNDGLYENYILNIPKTGNLTKIEFNNVNQLSLLLFTYDLEDITGTENLGADENFPYVIDFDPPIAVVLDEPFRIYTEYQEPDLTSIKVTII